MSDINCVTHDVNIIPGILIPLMAFPCAEDQSRILTASL